MSDSSDKPKAENAPSAETPLELGDFFVIGLVGEKLPPPSGKKGTYWARIYTGFLFENGYPHWVKRSFRTNDEAVALKRLNELVIPELQAAWDKRALELGVNREDQRDVLDTDEPLPDGSIAAQARDLIARWRKTKSVNTLAGYRTGINSFLRAAKRRASDPDHIWKLKEVEDIVQKMTSKCSKGKAGGKKKLKNAAYVLENCKGFPTEFLGCFNEVGRLHGTEADKQDNPFTGEEQAKIWKNLPNADPVTRGIILIAANSTQHGVDVANLTVKRLREACADICIDQRVKTEVAFRMVAWAETQEWTDSRKYGEHDIYVFPELMYLRRERIKNPAINQTPLNEDKEKGAKRRNSAAAEAGRLVKRFLVKVCEITRPGTSLHSFRYSNVSLWETEEWPRMLGMVCSGHLKEENYIDYARPLREFIGQISQRTHNFWAHADKEQVCILTKTQLYEALTVVIKAESDRVIRALEEGYKAQIAEMHRDHAAQTAAMREEHAAQSAETRKDHGEQNKKFDCIIEMLGSNFRLVLGQLCNFPAGDRQPTALIPEIVIDLGDTLPPKVATA